MDVDTAHDSLRRARFEGRLLTRFTSDEPGLDGPWGYAVQDADRRARLAAGEEQTGWKLGLTSAPKQRTMNVHEPIVGFLTDAMDGVDPSTLTQPRVEPELAFRLARDLDRPVDAHGAAAYVAEVCLALEVLDSRWEGYRFGLADVVADDTSAAGYLLGPWHPWTPDLSSTTCQWEVAGRAAEELSPTAILGDPLEALSHLSRHLSARAEMALAGSVVLAGAMADAVPLPTRVRLSHLTLGHIGLDANQDCAGTASGSNPRNGSAPVADGAP